MTNATKPRHLDLFSGIGGFALAARWAGFETVGFCERDRYCQRVLEKHWPGVFCHNDVTTFDGASYRNIDLLTGGFPCQPFSCAGKQRGAQDDRFLWPAMLRVIKEAKPAWIVGENVAGIVNMELDRCISDLEAVGYSALSFIIPACGVDAKHRRKRVWIVANAKHSERRPPSIQGDGACERQDGDGEAPSRIRERSEVLADPIRPGLEIGKEQPTREELETIERGCRAISDTTLELPHGAGRPRNRRRQSSNLCEWQPEPDVGRVANGIPRRVDRLRGLGNAIVPQVAFEILKAIREQLP